MPTKTDNTNIARCSDEELVSLAELIAVLAAGQGEQLDWAAAMHRAAEAIGADTYLTTAVDLAIERIGKGPASVTHHGPQITGVYGHCDHPDNSRSVIHSLDDDTYRIVRYAGDAGWRNGRYYTGTQLEIVAENMSYDTAMENLQQMEGTVVLD